MKYDCLIIDDEKALADNTCEYFNMFDVKTMAVYSRDEAITFLEENETSLILLDINLGDGSGFELCKHLRQTSHIPILFISARNTDDDKIIALSIGGDDYIEKPYSLGVLLAKVKVVLKRFSTAGPAGGENDGAANAYTDGSLKLDKVNKTLYMDGVEKKLTSMEYTLLEYLTANAGRLITKQELFDNVWKDRFTSDGTLNVHIRKLREAVETQPENPKRIVTVWKQGYKYNAGADA